MKKLIFIVIVALTTTVIVFSGCKKDDDDPIDLNRHVWVVGQQDSTDYGMILHSADGGKTWERQGKGQEALLNIDVMNVQAIDSMTVWAVGTNNSILVTYNGGVLWTRLPYVDNNTDRYLEGISALTKDNIWISGSPGVIYNTNNGGSTWTVFDGNFFQNNMQGIHAINEKTVYTVGQNLNNLGFIAKTSNGGTSWDSIVLEDNYNKNGWIGVKATSEENVVIYGAEAHYTHTQNGGVNWNNDSVPGAGGGGGPADINDLIMLDKNTWWGAFDLNNIYKTSNAGETWNKYSFTGPNMFLVGIDSFNDQNAVVAGQSTTSSFFGQILLTTDGGTTWESVYSTSSNLYKVSFAKY